MIERGNEKPLVSVVVPIYNVENYLEQCLDSIAVQTFNSYEVILVDDGSTDSSGEIAKKYEQTYFSFRLIKKENGGLSSARNAGIEKARGKYICFVDADDYIKSDYIEKLYSKAQEFNADMVIADYHEVDENGTKLIKNLGNPVCNEGIADRNDLLMALTSVGEGHYATAVIVAWNKLVRTEIMRRHLYPVGKLHEDEFVIMELLLDCERTVWYPTDIYSYRQRSGSIMQDAKSAMRHLEVLDAHENRIKLCYDINKAQNTEQSEELLKKMKWAYFWNIEVWYYFMRTKYNISSHRIHVYFSIRMLKAILKYHKILWKRKLMEYLIFVVSPEYYLKHIYS